MNKQISPFTGVIRVAIGRGWRVYCAGTWLYFTALSDAITTATDLCDQKQRAWYKATYIGEL